MIGVKPSLHHLRQDAIGRGMSAGQAREFADQQGEAWDRAARDAFRERLFERLGGIGLVAGVTSSSQKMIGSDWLSPSSCHRRPAIAGPPPKR